MRSIQRNGLFLFTFSSLFIYQSNLLSSETQSESPQPLVVVTSQRSPNIEEQGLNVAQLALGIRTVDSAAGPKIEIVEPKSVAEGVGLRTGDIITNLNGSEIYSNDEFDAALLSLLRKKGSKGTILGIRLGRPISMELSTRLLRAELNSKKQSTSKTTGPKPSVTTDQPQPLANTDALLARPVKTTPSPSQVGPTENSPESVNTKTQEAARGFSSQVVPTSLILENQPPTIKLANPQAILKQDQVTGPGNVAPGKPLSIAVEKPAANNIVKSSGKDTKNSSDQVVKETLPNQAAVVKSPTKSNVVPRRDSSQQTQRSPAYRRTAEESDRYRDAERQPVRSRSRIRPTTRRSGTRLFGAGRRSRGR